MITDNSLKKSFCFNILGIQSFINLIVFCVVFVFLLCVFEQKMPCCSLCGLQGHLLRTCPNRHCYNCSLPGHTYDNCLEKARWHKCCHRCGMTGHFIDVSSSMWVCLLRSVLCCIVFYVRVCVCVRVSLGPFFLSLRQTLHRL